VEAMRGADRVEKKQVANGAPTAEKLGWRLGMQAYTFNRFTFFEAVDKTASLGLHWIEAYPGQRLRPERAEVKLDHNAPEAVLNEVRAKLKGEGVALVCYGVVRLPNDEGECRKVFEFGKKMGVEVVMSEPPAEAFGMLDRLTEEYGMRIGLHNHPKPSGYWSPDRVLEVCKGHSERIGSCADTGHWMRSEVNPLDALRKLEGRIVSFHFKDLDKYGKDAHDVPWGTGKADVAALLAEVKRQGVRAVFSIEYEYNWDNSVPEIAECVGCFERVARGLAGGK